MDESGNLVVTGAKEYPLSQASPVLQWRGNGVVKKADGSLDDQVVREMLWELYELSFRLELQALDQKLSKADGVDEVLGRQAMVNMCFAGGRSANFMFYPPEIPVANAGLVSDELEERGPFIVSLARVMLRWQVPIPTTIQELASATNIGKEDLARLEMAVAGFYCQMFYDVRGRAPLKPHRIM